MTQALEPAKNAEPFPERTKQKEKRPHEQVALHPFLDLQRAAGNQAVLRLLASIGDFQDKPAINHSTNALFASSFLAVRPEPSGSQPGKACEQKADHIAAKVMRKPTPIIQRSCASCTAGGAVCPQCEEDELHLQRKSVGDAERVDSLPETFLKELGAGQPLDLATRAFFEPRFGRDFSSVRIHTDAPATTSARRINALAYTISNHVVVQRDHFAPGTDEGRRLLAHELTHTIQQGSSSFQQEGVISEPTDAAEQEAERIGAATTGPGATRGVNVNASVTDAGLQRQTDPSTEGPHDAGVPSAGVSGTEEDQRECVARLGGCPETRPGGLPTDEDLERYNKECRQELSYTGPNVKPACASDEAKKIETEPPPGGNMVHRKLSKADQEAIVAGAGGTVSTGIGPTFSKDGARFVLHDTATSFGPPKQETAHLTRLKAMGHTPVGEGAASYVTAAGAPEQTHSTFFSAQRPAASQFERANDLMDRFTRETTMQKVWSLTDPAERDAALARFLALFPAIPTKDVAAETRKAKENLDSTKSKPSNKASAPSVVMTTATGAATEICAAVAAKGAGKVAVAGQEAALGASCATLRPVLEARQARIADTTNVEIIADKGTDCSLGASAKPFSGYVPAVYDAVAKLYVLAALEAGQFPEITTHFFIDSITPAGSPGPVTTSQNRCDPRCFDLDLLYSKIAALLKHPAGTIYGVTPNYGTKFGTSNVWWPQQVCGTAHGTAAAAPKAPVKKKAPATKSPAKK